MIEKKEYFPKFAVDLDAIFQQYEHVYIVGDVHDKEDVFKTFILENNIGFIVANEDEINYEDISNYFLKPKVLLVFLGDILYKTAGHFKSIARFLLNNKNNCLLILGNNEIKFVYEHIKIFLKVCEHFLPRNKFKDLKKAYGFKRNFEIVEHIYSLINWFRCCSKSNCLYKEWNWYYDCLYTEFQMDKRGCEDLMILMYILTESIVFGFSNHLRLILIHAGLNPQNALKNQKINDICNIRNVVGTNQPWFVHYEGLDFVILYGHWSNLTTNNLEIKPFVSKNSICMDTGCFFTNVLTFLCFKPPSIDSKKALCILQLQKTVQAFKFFQLLLINR